MEMALVFWNRGGTIQRVTAILLSVCPCSGLLQEKKNLLMMASQVRIVPSTGTFFLGAAFRCIRYYDISVSLKRKKGGG